MEDTFMKNAQKNIVVIVILNICLSLVSWLDIASATSSSSQASPE